MEITSIRPYSDCLSFKTSVSGLAQTEPSEYAVQNRKVAGAVQQLNRADVAGPDREFSLSIDPSTKQAVVRVIDSNTQEVVEQFPSDFVLQMARELQQAIEHLSSPENYL